MQDTLNLMEVTSRWYWSPILSIIIIIIIVIIIIIIVIIITTRPRLAFGRVGLARWIVGWVDFSWVNF